MVVEVFRQVITHSGGDEYLLCFFGDGDEPLTPFSIKLRKDIVENKHRRRTIRGQQRVLREVE